MVYRLSYFVELRLAASLACASLSRRRVLGLRRFPARARRKQDHRHHTDADERANLLAQVHIITILSSLPSSLRSFVDDTLTHNTQILVVFRVHFTFVYLRFCPESSPVVHLRRACSASLPAALLWLPAKRRQQTRPCQEDTQKQAQHAAVD